MSEHHPEPSQPRYAWVILFVSFVVGGMAFGAIVNIAVFLEPLAAEFGWARGELAFAYSAATVAAGLGGIVMGYYSDRLPARRLVLVGAVTPGVAFFLLARLDTLPELYLYHALIGFLGFSAVNIPLTNVLTHWFTANRGLAVGLATAGGAVGQGLMPFLARNLILWQGWREAYVSLGILYLVVMVPLALLVRNPPDAERTGMGPGATNEEQPNPYALPREWLILLLCIAVAFCCITMATPIVHVVPLGSDAGLGSRQAAGLLTVMMIFGMFGRVLTGRMADRIGGVRAYAVTSFAQTVLAMWFPVLTTLTELYVLSALFGLGYAGVMTALILCAREWAPPRHTGMALGLVSFMGWNGMALGSWQGGWFYDITGSYHQAFLNATLSGAVNLAILAVLYHYTVSKPFRLAPQAA